VATIPGGSSAGVFSSTGGLVFLNTATGLVDVSASTAGIYTVTNTIAAAGGCALVSATSGIEIITSPVATFSYTATPYCQNGADPKPCV
jgi:PKD repeat protein